MKPSYHISLITLGVLSIATALSLIFFSLLNRPIADDVSYFRYFETGGSLHFLKWHYFGHTGRLLQSLLVTIGYLIAGASSVKIMPVLVYAFLAFNLAWASQKFIPWKKQNLKLSILTGTSLAGISVMLMPSIYDSYLWWTSSSIYLASAAFAVFTICATDSLIRGQISIRVQIALLILMALGQTLSEIAAVVLAGSSALLLGYFIYTRDRDGIRKSLYIFLALTAGFFVTYFSPGSMGRRSSEDGGQIGFDFTRIFIMSTKHAFELVASLSLWEVGLLIATGVTLSLFISPLKTKDAKKYLLAIAGALFIGIYGSFCINNYVWYNMPFRALTLPSFVLTLSAIALVTIISSIVYHKFKRSPFTQPVVLLTIVVLSVSSLIGLVVRSSQTVEFMKERNAAYTEREDFIKNQLVADPGTDNVVKMPALPILLKSQAVDLQYGAPEQVVWYENALRAHNLIPDDRHSIVTAPPKDYCTFGEEDPGTCRQLDDTTVFRRVIRKAENFIIYYFSTNP